METYSVTCWPPEVCLAELIIQRQTSYNYYTTNIALNRFYKIQVSLKGDIFSYLCPKNDFPKIPISV